MKSKAPVSRIGGTDYAAWDKFDADAEMERLEDDLKDDSDLTDECNENMYDEAIVEKEKVKIRLSLNSQIPTLSLCILISLIHTVLPSY